MPNYNSIYTGSQIDTAVSAVTTAIGNGGIVNVNGVQTILNDYLTRYEEITATFLSTSTDSGFITDQHGNFKHKRDTNTDYWQIQDNTGATKFSVYWETGIINCTNGIQFSTTSSGAASTHWISAGGGYSVNTGKSGVKLICCEQSDCLSGIGQDCGGGPYELSIITGQQPSSATTAYIRFLRHDTTSTTYTKLAELNGSGTFTIGYRVTSTAPSALTSIDRLILVPYYHTGGPWKITSRDDANNAYLSLYYNTTEVLTFHHSGTISATSNTNPVITHQPISMSYIAGVKGLGAGIYCKHTYNADQWYPVIAVDTKGGGGWAIGTYNSETLQFVYGTKANKDSNTNTVSILNLTAGNGNITTSVSSSIKIKENIHDFSIEEAKKLLQIRPVTFDYKKDYGEKNQYGFIAEEVDNIIPYVVYKPSEDIQRNKEEYWSIEYHKFIPWIIKLLQIQDKEIQSLNERIKQLENK